MDCLCFSVIVYELIQLACVFQTIFTVNDVSWSKPVCVSCSPFDAASFKSTELCTKKVNGNTEQSECSYLGVDHAIEVVLLSEGDLDRV